MRIEDVASAKTAELVTFYNAHNVEKPVTKFSDRKTAEKRVIALIEALAAIEGEAKEEAARVWEDENVRPVVVHKARKIAEKVEVNLEEVSDEEAEKIVKASLETSKKSNAAAIAKSWHDADVYNKRLTRNGVLVEVNGKSNEFKSTRAAFAALNLPDSKHIRFRQKLKAEKVAIFEWVGVSYKFTII